MVCIFFFLLRGGISLEKQHPMNNIQDIPVDKIPVSRAKELFNITYDDEVGEYKSFNRVFSPGETSKMVQIFRKAKAVPENLFYLGRMLLIYAYQPSVGRSKEQRLAAFQEGYDILMKLASSGYEPAQFYLGKITLMPSSTGMFSNSFYNNLGLPRRVKGPVGASDWCSRLNFTEQQKRDNLKDIKLKPISFFNRMYMDICPIDNGYGLKYSEAIAYLDTVGKNGNPKGYRVLHRYFKTLEEECSNKWAPDKREMIMIRRLAQKYKKLLQTKAP